MHSDFIRRPPAHPFLATLVDYYFYIDQPVEKLRLTEEYILPFPRITFGYFFHHPFRVTNHTLGQQETVHMAISRISSDKITVEPLSERVKIIGAHVRPYTLAYLTEEPIGKLPWLIPTERLFGEQARQFGTTMDHCTDPEQMFDEVEKIFLASLLPRDLGIIRSAVEMMEQQRGDLKLNEVAEQLSISTRTLRNQFARHIGCAPKEYLSLLRLRHAAYQLQHSGHSLTHITYESDYFDQPHFTHTVRQITGRTPKDLRKELAGFRFLQF